jgi:glucosyl-3-phosphoglycerate synthase
VESLDFNQSKIAKIHDFSMDFDIMSTRLENLKEEHPAGLIIPIIGSHLKNPEFAKIVREINECYYLKKVYIALSAETPSDYEEACKICRGFKTPCNIIWCNKTEVVDVLEELKKKGLDVTYLHGKGKDIWMAIGIASLELDAFAMHDADILSYTKMLPTRLLYPVVEPKLDFFFSKGYYARVNLETRKMYGRIYRLFINPLLEALQEKLQYSRFVTYLQSFSYALSGEIAISRDLALHLRIPSDWGFEMGTLGELFRNASYRRVCEIDLGFYDHKHKEMSKEALLRTAEDSLVTLLRTLTETECIEVSEPFLLSLQVVYRRIAQDKIRQYHADAACNNLIFDRHEEETNVDLLSTVIVSAGKNYLRNPVKAQLPEWLRAIAAMPDIRERLREKAIEQ